MYTQKLLVHNGSQRQGAEGVHAGIVDLLRVFVFAFELEREVVCEMSTLMIAAQQPQCVGIPNLERPQIEYTLLSVSYIHLTRACRQPTSMLK